MSEDKVKPKKVSLEEFRAWLEGVEEMQTVDWAPNQDQWKTIRGKIDNIVVPEKVVNAQPARVAPARMPARAEPVTSSLLAQPAPTIHQAPVAVGNPKTPDIDTSGGGYESGFV